MKNWEKEFDKLAEKINLPKKSYGKAKIYAVINGKRTRLESYTDPILFEAKWDGNIETVTSFVDTKKEIKNFIKNLITKK